MNPEKLIKLEEIIKKHSGERIALINEIDAVFGSKAMSIKKVSGFLKWKGETTRVKMQLSGDAYQAGKLVDKKGDIFDQTKQIFEREMTFLSDIEEEFFAKAAGLSVVDSVWIGATLQVDKLVATANALLKEKLQEQLILKEINRKVYAEAS